MFQPIKIPVTLSPHFGEGKPKGFYILAQRLWPGGTPILNKKQWIGYNGILIVTVQYPGKWDSLLKISIYAGELDGCPLHWLEKGSLYPMSKGFRMYVPSRILKPTSKDKVETLGIFRQCRDIYYLEIPDVTGDILLGRKPLQRKDL